MISKIQSGDNEAWESLYYNYERYVHDRVWTRLRKLNISEERKKDMEEELYQAGWKGFLSCVHAYDPQKGEFLTYAAHYIDGEMLKEIQFAMNSLGLTESGKKAVDITEFSYIHIFERVELDSLIQLVCFSDMFSDEDKQRLVEKLVSTASEYYRTPFQDGKKLRFNPKAIHGRFSGRIIQDNRQFAEKIKLIQHAVNDLCQIQFKFSHYTVEHEMIPKSEYLHVLSPYHLVVYHDNYYCIGLKKEDKRIWHYRVDLMSNYSAADRVSAKV